MGFFDFFFKNDNAILVSCPKCDDKDYIMTNHDTDLCNYHSIELDAEYEAIDRRAKESQVEELRQSLERHAHAEDREIYPYYRIPLIKVSNGKWIDSDETPYKEDEVEFDNDGLPYYVAVDYSGYC